MSIKRNDLVSLLVDVRPNLPDQLALKYSAMYPHWKEGITITQDDIDNGKNRYQYNGRLYKAVQPHTTQVTWEPDIITLALWVVIDVEHAGTLEDPIPAVAGMEYIVGKYYIEDGVIYQCKYGNVADGTAYTLAYLPSQLVNQYFVVVE